MLTVRRRLRRCQADDGFTVVELLVVLLLLGVVTTVVLGGVSTAFRQTVHAEARITALTDLQRVGANVAREVRAANSAGSGGATTALREAGHDRVQLDVHRNLGLATNPAAQGLSRIRLTYRVDGTSLVEDRQVWANRTDPTTGPATSSTTRVVLAGLDLSARPVFAHRTAEGACVTGCGGLSGAATTAQLPSIREVELYFRRDLGPGRGVIDVQTRIALRNA